MYLRQYATIENHVFQQHYSFQPFPIKIFIKLLKIMIICLELHFFCSLTFSTAFTKRSIIFVTHKNIQQNYMQQLSITKSNKITLVLLHYDFL